MGRFRGVLRVRPRSSRRSSLGERTDDRLLTRHIRRTCRESVFGCWSAGLKHHVQFTGGERVKRGTDPRTGFPGKPAVRFFNLDVNGCVSETCWSFQVLCKRALPHRRAGDLPLCVLFFLRLLMSSLVVELKFHVVFKVYSKDKLYFPCSVGSEGQSFSVLPCVLLHRPLGPGSLRGFKGFVGDLLLLLKC